MQTIEAPADAAADSAATATPESAHTAESLARIGVDLYTQGRQPDAVPYLRQALARRPNDPIILCNLGSALNEAGFPSAALGYLRQSARLAPKLLEAWLAMAFSLLRLQRPAEALAVQEHVLALKPDSPAALTAAAQSLQFLGRLDESLAYTDMALAHDPKHAQARFQSALTHLQMGDYTTGFAEFESRFAAKRSPARTFGPDVPEWDGSQIKSLLLWQDQGLGDSIQFSRYIRPLRDCGAEVIVECPAEQHRFMVATGASRAVTADEKVGADAHLSICSLPRIFGTTLRQVPIPARLEVSTSRMNGGTLNVGICWQGSRSHPWDMYRSIKAELFGSLARRKGVQFWNLQYPYSDSDARAIPGLKQFEGVDGRGITGDVMDTAVRLAGLDLVISVDTAVAHLAGTLGVPTWLLLSKAGEWRWLSEREDSPWYPSMRLYRQSEFREWRDVFERVGRDLVQQ